jgi:hypothetical protein
MLQLKDKLYIIMWIVLGIAVLVFGILRSCNQYEQENEYDNIEIIEIDNPQPTEFDRLCMSVTSQPCPKFSK